jgi:hypothetical protein
MGYNYAFQPTLFQLHLRAATRGSNSDIRQAMRCLIYLGSWILFWIGFRIAVGGLFGHALLSLGLVGYFAYRGLVHIPEVLGIVRIVFWIRDRRATIPQRFSGWAYGAAALGVISCLLVSAGTAALMFANRGGGMSGIPAGMSILFAPLFAGPALLYGETADILVRWRHRRVIVDGADGAPAQRHQE